MLSIFAKTLNSATRISPATPSRRMDKLETLRKTKSDARRTTAPRD